MSNMSESLPLDDKTLKAYEAYLCLQKNRSPHTVRSYLQTIRSLSCFSAAHGKNSEVSQLLRDFIRDAASQKGAKSSQAQRGSAIRNFINWSPTLNSETKATLLRHVQSPKIPKRIPRILELSDIEKILSHIKEQSTEEQLVFFLLYGSGLRISEALGATWNNVNLTSASLKVLGKGSKERVVPLVPALMTLLKNLKKNLPDGHSRLLDSRISEFTVRKWVRQWGRDLELEDKNGQWHPHKLRHSIASHLLQMGAKVPQIQKLLGHENLATTEKYTHLNPSDLLKIYKKAMPLP